MKKVNPKNIPNINKKDTLQKPAQKKPERTSRKPFYIVAMGGSAGGLEAFEQFFSVMPPDSGLAFVIITHLDPDHKGIMPEIIQRSTKMKVCQVTDGMKVRPNSVYIIPPKKDMSILHGTLHLLDQTVPRGVRMPIDFFFRHLSDDQQERGIGIILSGMGTDGTLGIRAIKEKLGLAMVQDPKTAKYDGMPLSAIACGIVDYIAPAEELPVKLLRYVKHTLKIPQTGLTVPGKTLSAIQKICILIRAKTGHDFSLYKKNTIYRRIERRMSVHQISSIAHYIRYLQENPGEIELLFKEFLIGVTNFFRDPGAFEVLIQKAIPQMLKGMHKDSVIRIWIPGCSTGEEAYSIAIILREHIEKTRLKNELKLQIFATDIDKDAIDKARYGVYPANIAVDLSPERLQKFFIKEDSIYRIRKEIREMIVFAPQSIMMDPPFTKLDMLCCRNLLIYLNAEVQKKILPLFHYALKPGGILFLGPSETIGSFNDLFAPIDNKWKIFRRKESSTARAGMVDLPSSLLSPDVRRLMDMGKTLPDIEPDLPDMVQQALIESYTPPAVLINENGDILYISGRTGNYLEPSAGKAAMNIYAMAREGLRYEVGTALHKAVTQKTTVMMTGLKVMINGACHVINLTVKPVAKPGAMYGTLLVVFEDVTAHCEKTVPVKGKVKPASAHGRYKEVEDELKRTREQLQASIEEANSSQEEIKSTNEELQSTNEELQSTNEELTTSKEELQSLNEELITVNAELQNKVDELTQTNNDMKNLLNSTDIATIFVDNDLNVKRFTTQATKIIALRQSDIGRPLTDLVTNLEYAGMVEDIKDVIHTLIPRENQVETKDGRQCIMRIMPYRTLDHVIDGAVITFNDITNIKLMEDYKRENIAIKEALIYTEDIINTVREPLIVLNSEFCVVSASRAFYTTFQVSQEETEGKSLFGLGNHEWDMPSLRQLLEKILPKGNEFNDFVVEHEFPNIGYRKMLLNARRISGEKNEGQLILLAIEDITKAVSSKQ
ncbi:MAG: PAS domain-containing protein [Nitrospirae bacterium]|nr:PAS domain-containing protein [Nitrospirota bacterium]